MASLTQALPSRRFRRWIELLIVSTAVGLAFLIGRLLPTRPLFVYLILLIPLGMLVLIKPRLGLYVLPVTLFVIPFDWRIPGLKFTSASTVAVGAALVGWAGSIALHRLQLLRPSVLVPLVFAAFISWANFLRQGTGFLNLPLIFSESLLLFVLGHHLIRKRSHARWLLGLLFLALIYRNALDIVVSLQPLQRGHQFFGIVAENMIYGGASTTEAEVRLLFLPVLILSSMATQNSRERVFLGLSVVLDLTWLALSFKRTAIAGVMLVFLSLMVLVSRRLRRRLLILSIPLAVLFVLVIRVWTGALDVVLLKMESDLIGLEMGTGGGRLAANLQAFQAFLNNPLLGSSGPGNEIGTAHSYLLQAARGMGLLFLVPFALALWIIWHRGAWLRRQKLDPMSRAFVLGIQATVLVALPLNLLGTAWQAAGYSFVFWLLIGIQEAIYDDVREGRYVIVDRSASSAMSRESPSSGDIPVIQSIGGS